MSIELELQAVNQNYDDYLGLASYSLKKQSGSYIHCD